MLNRFVLFSFLLSFVSVGVAQEVEGNGKSSGAIFSPADYLQIITPVTKRVTVSTYGFYLGNLRTSIALLEVPITLQKHFVVTPSYLFVNVPPVGLSLLTNQTANCNMYVRRFTPTSEINRYRNKIYVSHPTFPGLL